MWISVGHARAFYDTKYIRSSASGEISLKFGDSGSGGGLKLAQAVAELNPLNPGLFTEPCSAGGDWRFRGPRRPLSGALSRVWRWLAEWSHHRACFRRILGAGGHVLRMTAGRAEAVSGSQTVRCWAVTGRPIAVPSVAARAPPRMAQRPTRAPRSSVAPRSPAGHRHARPSRAGGAGSNLSRSPLPWPGGRCA